jgi:spore maturation protein A
MLSVMWLGMMLLAVVFGVINGKTTEVVNAVTEYAKLAFSLALSLGGIMAFWLGVMKIAERSGLISKLSRAVSPLLRLLFKDIPEDSPALGAVVMNIAANMLGLANAATPLGLKAMEELQKENNHKSSASDAMCMFLAINTSSVQLIPVTAIAYLAASGSSRPTEVITSALLSTLCSTLVAIFLAKLFAKMKVFRLTPTEHVL